VLDMRRAAIVADVDWQPEQPVKLAMNVWCVSRIEGVRCHARGTDGFV
jgi:hypothetical protein